MARCDDRRYVEDRLNEEAARADQCLHIGTRKPLISQIESHLIAQHVTEIIAKGLCPMLEDVRLEDLSRWVHGQTLA